MPSIPLEENREFNVEPISLKRNENPARALVLQCQDQSLDEADASMLPDSPVPCSDPIRATPCSETWAVELLLLVADQVARRCAHSSNHTADERAESFGAGFVWEHRESLDLPGVVCARPRWTRWPG